MVKVSELEDGDLEEMEGLLQLWRQHLLERHSLDLLHALRCHCLFLLLVKE